MASRRILVIQRAYLGDLILTLPLVRRLHEGDPEAAITVAVRRGFEAVVRDQPGVSGVLSMRKRRGLFDRLGHDRGTFRDLRGGRFDEVYLAHRSFRSGLYAWATRAPRRIGFAGSKGRWACTEQVPYDARCHLVERLLALAGVDTGAEPMTVPSYDVPAAAAACANELLKHAGVDTSEAFACMAPGSSWETKRWTPGGFATLARRLAETGLSTVLVGSPAEKPLCAGIREQAGQRVHDLCGTTIPEMAAILARGRLFVGNDSGTGHLAAAVGSPVVTIFGPTAPELGYLPLGARVLAVETAATLDCRPCGRHGARRCPRGHHRCMRDLTPDKVLDDVAGWKLNPLRGRPSGPRG